MVFEQKKFCANCGKRCDRTVFTIKPFPGDNNLFMATPSKSEGEYCYLCARDKAQSMSKR